MVKIRISGKSYSIASSWKDVTLHHLQQECDSVFKELSVFSDIPMEVLTQLAEEQLFAIALPLSFLADAEDLELILMDVPVVDVEVESYEKLELAKMCISNEKKLYQILYGIAKVYYPEEKDVIKLLSLGNKLLIAIDKFLSNYTGMFNKVATDEEIKAGIEQLSSFGVFGTAFTLAGKDLLKMDKILATPAISVYTALHYSFREGEYIKALYEIKYKDKTLAG